MAKAVAKTSLFSLISVRYGIRYSAQTKFNSKTCGFATSLTREARFGWHGIGGDTVGAAICRPWGCAKSAAGPRPRPTARRRFVQKDRRGRRSLHFTPRSGISHSPAGENIALREQYIAPPTGGISFIAKGDEYERPSPSRFACHLSPRGEARFGSRWVRAKSAAGESLPCVRGGGFLRSKKTEGLSFS